MNTVKKHAGHGFSQFKLTNYLLNNLQHFEVSPIAKLVLLELSACYNPKKADMFPKQKTIALKIGCSERSVVRAIQELFKAGLIVIECKYSNRYSFTSKITNLGATVEEKVSDDLGQNDIQNGDNLSPHEPMNEPIKEPVELEDFKILKEYAEQKGAKNVTGYINALKKNGSDKKIIQDYKAKKAADNRAVVSVEETSQLIEEYENQKGTGVSSKSNLAIKEVLQKHWGK